MAGADRKRRYRDRIRRGAVVVPIEFEPLDGVAMVDSGLISTNEVEDRAAISRAFRRLLDSLRDASPSS